MKTNRSHCFYVLTLLLCFSPFLSYSQKAKKQSASYPHVHKPIFPAKDIQSLSLLMHTKGVHVTADTIRAYDLAIENMDERGRTPTPSYYPQGPITIQNYPADINFEVAFGAPSVVERELNSYPCGTTPGCKKYNYMVKYKLPCIVAATNKSGEVLEIWSYNPTYEFKFGSESFNKLVQKEAGFTYSMRHMTFKSEKELNDAFENFGTSWLNRKAVLRIMGHVINSSYSTAFVKDSYEVFDLTTGKGKSHDYSDLTAVNEEAIEIMKQIDNRDAILPVIEKWKTMLQQSNLDDKKAKINDVITHGLYKNIAVAYAYLEDYDKAMEYAVKHRNSVPQESRFTAASNLSGGTDNRAQRFHLEIYKLKLAEEANKGLTQPENVEAVPNLKKIYGKRKKSKDLNFTSNEDKYEAFKAELIKKNEEIEAALNEGVAPSPSENNPYSDEVQVSTTQGFQLMLVSFTHAQIVGKEMPSEITELTQLNRLIAPGMKFTAVPSSIGNLKDLVALNLKGSNLKEVPESIGKLKKLKTLNLGNNDLTTLPASIQNMTELKSLVLKGNNFSKEELDKIKAMLPAKCKIKI